MDTGVELPSWFQVPSVGCIVGFGADVMAYGREHASRWRHTHPKAFWDLQQKRAVATA
jgi:hypothetical protein